jgi:cytochrome c
MKKSAVVLAAFGLAAVASPALASEALAKKHACTACHAVDRKLVGPSYKDVAAKYRGDANAEAALLQKVKKGSTGTWGPVPMPPNPKVPDDDAAAIVKWILATK